MSTVWPARVIILHVTAFLLERIDFSSSGFTSDATLSTGFHGNYTWKRSWGFTQETSSSPQKNIISQIQHYSFLYLQNVCKQTMILTGIILEAVFIANFSRLLQIFLWEDNTQGCLSKRCDLLNHNLVFQFMSNQIIVYFLFWSIKM